MSILDNICIISFSEDTFQPLLAQVNLEATFHSGLRYATSHTGGSTLFRRIHFINLKTAGEGEYFLILLISYIFGKNYGFSKIYALILFILRFIYINYK